MPLFDETGAPWSQLLNPKKLVLKIVVEQEGQLSGNVAASYWQLVWGILPGHVLCSASGAPAKPRA